MLITLDTPSGQWQIKSYSHGKLTINEKEFTDPIFLLSDRLISPWHVTGIDELKLSDLPPWDDRPDILLLGTGATLVLPPKTIIQWCSDNKIGLEALNTRAACRTYNALTAEGRKVVAGFIL